MSDKKVRATLTLLPTIDDGPKSAVPTGSPSLLFTFLSDEKEVQVGGSLHIKGSDRMEPGETASVMLGFWHDDGLAYAIPGARFDVWYGRVVGHGQVVENDVL